MRHLLKIALVLSIAAGIHADDLQVAPREVGPAAEPSGLPLLVSDGTDFVVIWQGSGPPRFARIRHSDEVLFSGDFGRPGQVVGAVAGPNGTVLAAFSDADGVHVAAIDHDNDVRVSGVVAPSFAALAWNGSRLLIVTRGGDTVLTDSTGRVRSHGAHLPFPEDLWSPPSASGKGDGFVVAWAETDPIHVTTLTSSGAIAKAEVFPGRQIGEVAIGCDPSGASCLLLSAARVPLTGEILGKTAPFRISADLLGDAIPPVWDGQRFLVGWTDYTFGDQSFDAAVRIAAVSVDGTVTPLATIAAPDRTREMPAIAHANGETVVAWADGTRCGWAGSQVIARSLTTDHELRLTSGLSTQHEPAIAAGNTTALVAWAEHSGVSRIRARLFPFTEPAFDVAAGPAAAAPVIGSDGTGYLVAWRESLPEEDCRNALRISLAGSGTISTLGHNAAAYQILWTGSEYVVVWEQDDPAQLFAMRVDRSGQPIDAAPVALSVPEADPDRYTTIDHHFAGLFPSGNGYLLLWRRSRSSYIPFFPDPPPQFDVRTTMLGPSLVPAGAPQTIAPAYDVVATGKGNSVVTVWKAGGTFHAFRLAPDGAILADRDLGITAAPSRIIPTRSGYAMLFWNEILFLSEDLSLLGRRPTAGPYASLAQMSGGIVEVYAADDTVYLSPPAQRRRSMR